MPCPQKRAGEISLVQRASLLRNILTLAEPAPRADYGLPDIFRALGSRVLNPRWLLLCSALLFANGAYADGTYQRTKNHKTLVWNSDPKPGDAASWSGARDKEGYASGFGTLTWYTPRQSPATGTDVPSGKLIVFGSYFGNMVRGKFEGSVNVHSKGKTAHASFVDGKRTSRWASGTAPSRTRMAAETRAEPLEQKAAAEPAPPAAGPSRVTAQRQNQSVHGETIVDSDAPAAGSPHIQRKADQHASPAPKETPPRDMDDSLRALVGPPSMLRNNAVAEPSPASSTAPASSAPPAASPN